jgi:hypothetical protein
MDYFRNEEVIWRLISWRDYREHPILRYWYYPSIRLDGTWKDKKNVIKEYRRPNSAETQSPGGT